jgi:hypothetical protein
MKKDYVDFDRIETHQLPIHDRLRNWGMWVSVRPQKQCHPMFRLYHPAQHWEAKEFRETCDILDAQRMEKVVGTLPMPFAYSLRWFYVYRFGLGIVQRQLATTAAGVHRMTRDARQMVINLVD